MKNETSIDEILILIDNLDTVENSKAVLGINKFKAKMKENSVPQDQGQTKIYATKLTQQALDEGTLPRYNDTELVRTKKSTQHKEVIREVVAQFDAVADTDNPALSLAWSRVKRSTSILELRTNLEMYISIKDSIHNNDIQEYVEMLDEQDREIRSLKEYKRIYMELFDAFTEDDEEIKVLSDINKGLNEYKLNDTQICKVFNIQRDRFNRMKKKYNLGTKNSSA